MLGYMLYTRALENVILWGLLVLPLAELTVLCLFTLNNLPPQRRRGLFALFFIMLALAVVLFGGALALNRYGLAWRTWFQEGLSFILWLAGLTTGTMTVGYAGRWLARRGGTVKRAITVLSSLCLASTLLVGTLLGGLWALGPSEQVVSYAGERVILGKWISSCQLYSYHGPLVRGAGPLLVDWDESLVEWAVNVPRNTPW